MTQLQKENIDLLVKLKQVKKRYNDKLEKEVDSWIKWTVGLTAGGVSLGLLAGLSIAKFGI